MHRARAFFFVCAGLLCLAVAYHLGATSAGAQAPGNPLVAAHVYATNGIAQWAWAANGDEYSTADGGATWAYRGNVFSASGPTPTA